ncbi:MAG: hypothetical protein HN742_04730 [Lentisphaerae bacterium]|jgi:hypothetical protein|nr:hypothetical protein [Lentisphaerota bacterium]MBT4815858.1 hypothetical protein [Lentisphaerota bacterium]MBT5610878.1 hypothetical protein [Lentisphaerota bacterium]MBT7053690.1 hypothetical protein [Lentisphaerota bacterium]MBT7841151.1 hypothetical protein [Lentisphaerota bacterium]
MMRRTRLFVWCVGSAAALLLAGCGRKPTAAKNPETAPPKQNVPAAIFLTEAPSGVMTVPTLKESAKEGDEVVVRGVVGGRGEPFVSGRAVWSLIEGTLPNLCTREGHGCTMPWDYCCATPEEKKPNMLTVQITGDDARPLAVDLQAAGKIKPMDTLVVKGTVGPRPTKDTLVLTATGIYVELAK